MTRKSLKTHNTEQEGGGEFWVVDKVLGRVLFVGGRQGAWSAWQVLSDFGRVDAITSGKRASMKKYVRRGVE